MSEKVFGSKKQGSIKDIPLPERSTHPLDLSGDQPVDSMAPKQGGIDDWGKSSARNKRKGTKLIVFGLVVLGLLVAYSLLFHSAEVVLTKKTQNAVLTNQEFNATLQGEEGSLAFIRVKPFSAKETVYVEGSIEENRQTKTSGMITVFNTDSSDKNYIKNTRFQSPDGNVYRAFNRFVIPKGTTENPGSVDVLVVAENPGDKYNSEEGLTFVLPALKEQGDSSFDKVYAEQKEPLTGGYSGVVRVPIEDDIAEAQTKLQTRLEQSLFDEFKTTLPDSYVVNEDYVVVSDPVFTQKPNEEKGGVDLEARSELYAVVFKQDDYSRFMAQQFVQGYNGESVVVTNANDLPLNIVSENFDPATSESFTFTTTGEARFEWAIDQDEIQSLLAGKLRSHVENDLVVGLDYIEVEEIKVSPFWRRSLPKDVDSITVSIK